ncbi:MAG TPA: choice-of-anchor tandem repeat GloVer-containing protein [Chthonomonadaceae bacterium]|nr:choice-of-anchor tandem repeat GloVer-containing protein [Chthonomonadaceae bacterium]
MHSRMQGGLVLILGAFLFLAGLFPATAQSPSFVTLYAFSSDASGVNNDGAYPRAGLILGSDGYFYGATANGGAHGNGTIFKISANGAFTPLYSFSATTGSPGTNTNGANPYAELYQGSGGNFYGTTRNGGANGYGVVFQMTPAGTVTTLHAFSATGSDGGNPYAGLIEGPDGNFYGTTTYHGNGGAGTVFVITPGGTLTHIHSFPPSSTTDGANPESALVLGSDGDFYGTTFNGGADAYGTIYKISSTGTETLLYSFDDTTGAFPRAPLLPGSDGNFYGAAFNGGTNALGTLFRMTTAGVVTVLHDFAGSEGAYPNGLIEGKDGNFYGTTYGGGANNYGTIFELTPAGAYTTLHSFDNTNGSYPRAGLAQDASGNFYGTTYSGGANGDGIIFGLVTGSPVPILTGISPTSANAGGPAFTLTAKGSAFTTSSTVNWKMGTNTTALTTTYVSATQLKAAVPAALIANAGKAAITVVTPAPGGGTSAAKTFTVLVTTVKLASATLSRDSSTGVITANITLKNVGYNAASNTNITKATLGAASTTTTLPASVGSIAAGSTGTASLTFPGSAGTSGQVVTLKVSGAFTGGKFSGSLKVTLP